MTFLMTWSRPTSCHQTAYKRIFVTFVWQALCLNKAEFFPISKSSVSSVLEKETWESSMWTMQRSTVRTRLTWNWCFKSLMFISRIWPTALCSTLCHNTTLRIAFTRTWVRLTICMQDGLSAFSFIEFLQVKVLISPSTSISTKVQFFNTMNLFNYNPSDKAGSYIAQESTHPRRLFRNQQYVRPGEGNGEATSCYWEKCLPKRIRWLQKRSL